MSFHPEPESERKRFTHLLHRALTQGRAADGRTGLGPRTEAAIVQVAGEHPDATVDTIAAAYDAFHDEHQ